MQPKPQSSPKPDPKAKKQPPAKGAKAPLPGDNDRDAQYGEKDES